MCRSINLPSDHPSRDCPCRRLVFNIVNMVDVKSSDRGLPPYKFMPMPGVHPTLKRTAAPPLSSALCVAMNNGSIKVLGLTLFLFTVYNHAPNIILAFKSNHGFITSNLAAIALVAISFTCVISAFRLARYFWQLCVALFLWYPFSIFFLLTRYPDLIYLERIPLDVDSYELTTQNLGIPLLLRILSTLIYVLVSRKERAA